MEMKSLMRRCSSRHRGETHGCGGALSVLSIHGILPCACCCISLCWHLPVPAAKQNRQRETGLGPAAAAALTPQIATGLL